MPTSVSQSNYLLQIIYINLRSNLHTKCWTVQIQISWFLQKPTDQDLHCLRTLGISSFSRAIINPGPAESGYPAFANSVDPDQLASEESSWSGSALFAIKYVN